MAKFLQRCADYARKGLYKGAFYAYFGSTIFWMMPYVHSPPLQQKEVCVREIPVVLAVDKQIGDYPPIDRHTELQFDDYPLFLIQNVNSIFKSQFEQCPPQLVVQQEHYWDFVKYKNMEDLIREVKSVYPETSNPETIIIALVEDIIRHRGKQIKAGNYKNDKVVAVSTKIGWREDDTNGILHEVGHLLGAGHSSDPKYSMFGGGGYANEMKQSYDPEAKAAIWNALKENYPEKKVNVPYTRF